MDKKTRELYQARNKALNNIIKSLTKKGHTIQKLSNDEKKQYWADFYLDGTLSKFKMTRNPQVNILFEVMNSGRYSWFELTKADYYIFYIEPEEKIYIIDIQRTRDYIKNPLHTVEKTTKGSLGNQGWSYMIPIKTLLDYDIIKSIINIK